MTDGAPPVPPSQPPTAAPDSPYRTPETEEVTQGPKTSGLAIAGFILALIPIACINIVGVILAIVALAAILFLIGRSGAERGAPMTVALALIFGGAIGNIIDRLRFGEQNEGHLAAIGQRA